MNDIFNSNYKKQTVKYKYVNDFIDANYKKQTINSISNIKLYKNKKIHYKYKKFEFLYASLQKNSNLVVFFHGAIQSSSQQPIFRGYQYCNLPNTDILSISDVLMNIYKKENLLLSWYLTTPKYPNNFSEYTKIIGQVLKKQYKKVIFTGGSGGGYPAIVFSSYFKKHCLLQNSQIYLNKYSYFDTFLKITENKEEEIQFNIEEILKKQGPPKRIFLCQNIRDTNHYKYHAKPFVVFLMDKYPNCARTLFFYGATNISPNVSDHHINLPTSIPNLGVLLKKTFQIISN